MSSSAQAPLRYRLYYWLMDASLVGLGVFIASIIYESTTGLEGFGLNPTLKGIVGLLLLFFIAVVPVLLIVGRPLRDEYAETLWKDTVAQLVLILAVVPLVVGILLRVSAAYWAQAGVPVWLEWLYEEALPVDVMSFLWACFVMSFVALFQFNRWRNSK